MLPKDWNRFRLGFPSINWDNDILSLKLDLLSNEEKACVQLKLTEILANYGAFCQNMIGLKDRKIPRCPYVGDERHALKNIYLTLLFVFCDANGNLEKGILGAVAYIKTIYMDKTCSWLLCSAASKLAKESMTIPKRELASGLLGTKLAKVIQNTLKISPDNTHYYMDSAISIQQIQKYELAGPPETPTFTSQTIKKLKKEAVTLRNFRFVPGKHNSADKITRPCTVDDIFGEKRGWFRPHEVFDEMEVPKFEIDKLLIPSTEADDHAHALLSTNNERGRKGEKKPYQDLGTKYEMLERIIERSCSLNKATRTLAKVIRIAGDWKKKSQKGKLQQIEKLRTYILSTEWCKCIYCTTRRDNEVLKQIMFDPIKNQKTEAPGAGGLIASHLLLKDRKGKDTPKIDYACGDLQWDEGDWKTLALYMFIEAAQRKYYPLEAKTLENGGKIQHKHNLTPMDPFLNQIGLIQLKGRIGYNVQDMRNQEFLEEHSTHYPLLIPNKGRLTYLVIMETHQKTLCSTATWTENALREDFYMEKMYQTIKKTTLRCYQCIKKRSLKNRMESSVCNLPGFRIPKELLGEHNRPYNIVMWDIKGPCKLRDDIYARVEGKIKRGKRQKRDVGGLTLPENRFVKAYILTITCVLTRHNFLEVIQYKSYIEVKAAFTRFICQYGAPSLAISDCDPAFKALSRDMDSGEGMSEGFASSKEKRELEEEFRLKFKFNSPGAPEKNALVERIHGYISNSMLRFSESGLRVSQYQTLVKMGQAVINSRPIAVVKEGIPISPQELVFGYRLHLRPRFAVPKSRINPGTIQSTSEIIAHTKHIQFLFSHIWAKFQIGYIASLNSYRKKCAPTQNIVPGDVVLYSQKSEKAPKNEFCLCVVLDVSKNTDGSARNLKVRYIKEHKKNVISRPLNQFCKLEITDIDAKTVMIGGDRF